MGWSGSGTFNRLYSWVADKAAGLDISSSRMDADTNDITSNGFGNCLTRDGQGQPTTNLPMANFRHTGVGSGVARTDYAAMAQAQDGLIGWTIAGGTSDAITATYTPSRGAPSDGALYCFRATAANTTTTPTFAPDGQTARTITKRGGSALFVGDIPGNLAEVFLRYNNANTRYELINPAISKAPQISQLTGSGTYSTPAGALYLIVDQIGGGGGGGGNGTGAANAGNGGATTFGSVTANGGGGGTAATTANGQPGGAGGSAGSGSASARFPGGRGGPGANIYGTTLGIGGYGAVGYFGGSGSAGTTTINPVAGADGSGAGGGGAGSPSASFGGGGGGGSGEYTRTVITSPSATYSYSVGAAGTAGAAGTGGASGSTGGAGTIIVTACFQ